MRVGEGAERFRLLPVASNLLWKEVAFWEPQRRVLVVGDALGTADYFTAPGQPLGVHPLLRLRPPWALGRLAPRHLLCGHGPGIHGDEAALALEAALATARRRIPSWLLSQVRKKR
jgi:glyoxylase-like metal-dependent hydrolase (beta-lactamase superfamily II)